MKYYTGTGSRAPNHDPNREVRFNSRTRNFRFLSNSYPAAIRCTFRAMRFTLPTAEHSYQLRKLSNNAPYTVVQQAVKLLVKEKDPAKAKRLGRQFSLRRDWRLVKEDIMMNVLRAKFHQNMALKQQLLETGEMELVHITNCHDIYWAVCECKDHRGKGMNRLGELLKNLREEIRVKT